MPRFDDSYGWESFEIEDINNLGFFTGIGQNLGKYFPLYGIPITEFNFLVFTQILRT